mmetsp:Transcript_24713/g.71087  ORF Transcript_24713/g.71087 Transcript_24713/m.71087 type:complete len:377 (+) Transcript_24713:72-1202(+)
MSAARKLDITIAEAQLVRIFDSLKPNQDVFVQLVCGYADGTEKVVGRTETCKNGNFHPRWNERFLCGRDAELGSRTLKFRVNIDHLWRSPVLCGEAEFSLDNLWRKASGGAQRVPVPLFKRGEQTGMLNITITLDAAGKSFSGPAANGYPGLPRDAMPAGDNALYTTPQPAASAGATPGLTTPGLTTPGGATPGGASAASAGTPYYTPAGGTPYGTPAGDGGPRLMPTRSPNGAPRYEFIPKTPVAADGVSPAHAAFQQPPAHFQAAPQAAEGQSPAQAAFLQALQAKQFQPQAPCIVQQAQPAPPLLQQSPGLATALRRLEPPGGPAAAADPPAAGGVGQLAPCREAGSQGHSPGGSVYATGASGQWWNSFIDRG